ncbi:SubName: Full=Uncharacterized protein {ECO:0000313/EMBL:CCA75388.1} [Serendipita indica DSM 11827]|nr:SubName: Full=Uncharacterized protein {ECO:0000313/EMBL:CCA75388.1} [Serendipita indica DSM 11827]
MSLLYLISFVFCALYTIQVRAAPTDQNVLLAKKYAPQFRFHKDEVYFPSTVEYFVNGPVTVKDSSGKVVATKMDTASDNGVGTYMSTDVNANLNEFLRGQNPSSTQTSTYVFIAPKDNGVVDLYYWIYCPYNLGKKIPVLGWMGNHVGDWERITIRTVNGVATSIDYHAHDDKGSGTIPYAQAPKFSPSSPSSNPDPNNSDSNARPVAYVAQGSHGMWSSAGTFTYIDAVVLKLQDSTSDNGVYWDTQNNLVTINYPDTYSDSLAWLNYKGSWGNKGSTNCWWYFIYKQCELVSGPNGPLRDDVVGSRAKTVQGSRAASSLFDKANMKGTLSQTLATVSSGDSRYTLHIAAPVVASVGASTPFITIEQLCAARNSTSTDEDPEYTYTSTYISAQLIKGTTQYTISVPACDGPSYVAAYNVGSCSTDLSESTNEEDLAKCTFGTARKIRTFSDKGIEEVAAVLVDDLDNWSL